MSRETTIIILGFLVAVLPFSGFPESWRTVFLALAGIGLVVFGFMMRAEVLSRGAKKDGRQPFAENGHGQGGAEIRTPGYEHHNEEKIG